jgi:hypothetical protein
MLHKTLDVENFITATRGQFVFKKYSVLAFVTQLITIFATNKITSNYAAQV